jgi:hypothetical protein
VFALIKRLYNRKSVGNIIRGYAVGRAGERAVKTRGGQALLESVSVKAGHSHTHWPQAAEKRLAKAIYCLWEMSG